MGYSVHILRRTDAGAEMPITLDEWNTYVDSDPELRRPEPGEPNYNSALAVLWAESKDSENWPWICWGSGSISSDYPPLAMLRKMRTIAQYFGAVVESDDGDVWTISEDGSVQVHRVAQGGDDNSSASMPPAETTRGGRTKVHHFFGSPSTTPMLPLTDEQPAILVFERAKRVADAERAIQPLAEVLNTVLNTGPVVLPIANKEVASKIAEQLANLGYDSSTYIGQRALERAFQENDPIVDRLLQSFGYRRQK